MANAKRIGVWRWIFHQIRVQAWESQEGFWPPRGHAARGIAGPVDLHHTVAHLADGARSSGRSSPHKARQPAKPGPSAGHPLHASAMHNLGIAFCSVRSAHPARAAPHGPSPHILAVARPTLLLQVLSGETCNRTAQTTHDYHIRFRRYTKAASESECGVVRP